MHLIGSTISLIILAANADRHSSSRNAVSFSSARTPKDFPLRGSSTLLLMVQHRLRRRLAGNDCRAEAIRDFRSRHLDTFLPNFVVSDELLP
jgi:hypothetical protein